LLEWSPAQLPSYAGAGLVTGELPEHTLPASILAAAIIIILLWLSVIIFKKKELETS
jgi:ABC-2 type transport system permease protein